MKVWTTTQGDEAWRLAKLGRPSASNADRILTPKTRKPASGRVGYMAELLSEWALGREVIAAPEAGGFMGRGSREEAEAIAWLEFEKGFDIERVGFCTLDDESFGWSLDGRVVGSNQNVETKVPSPKQHVANLLDPDGFVADHYGQIQSGLMGSGAHATWLVSYHLSLPKVVRLVARDEEYISAFRGALATFTSEMAVARAKLIALGCPIHEALPEGESETF